jgi:hypothetical protein
MLNQNPLFGIWTTPITPESTVKKRLPTTSEVLVINVFQPTFAMQTNNKLSKLRIRSGNAAHAISASSAWKPTSESKSVFAPKAAKTVNWKRPKISNDPVVYQDTQSLGNLT